VLHYFVAVATLLAPGWHVLGLFCRINHGIMIGDAQTFQREVEVELAPSGRYRVAASARRSSSSPSCRRRTLRAKAWSARAKRARSA